MRHNPYNEIESTKPVTYSMKTMKLTIVWFDSERGLGIGEAANATRYPVFTTDFTKDPAAGDVVTCTVRVKD